MITATLFGIFKIPDLSIPLFFFCQDLVFYAGSQVRQEHFFGEIRVLPGNGIHAERSMEHSQVVVPPFFHPFFQGIGLLCCPQCMATDLACTTVWN